MDAMLHRRSRHRSFPTPRQKTADAPLRASASRVDFARPLLSSAFEWHRTMPPRPLLAPAASSVAPGFVLLEAGAADVPDAARMLERFSRLGRFLGHRRASASVEPGVRRVIASADWMNLACARLRSNAGASTTSSRSSGSIVSTS